MVALKNIVFVFLALHAIALAMPIDTPAYQGNATFDLPGGNSTFLRTFKVDFPKECTACYVIAPICVAACLLGPNPVCIACGASVGVGEIATCIACLVEGCTEGATCKDP